MTTVRERPAAAATIPPGSTVSRIRSARARARALEPILQSVSDGVVVVDPQGRFLLFNAAASRILDAGLLDVGPDSWARAYGLFLPDRVTPYPSERLPLVRAMAGETVRDVEIFVRRPDPAEGVMIRVNAMPWVGPTGALLGAVAVFRDITAHRIADETVRRLSNAVEQTADAVYITDRAGVIEYVNPGFELITGYSRGEAVGQTPRLLHSGHHDATHYRELWGTLLAGRVFRGTMVNRRKNGEIFYAEMTITPIMDSGGTVTHFVAVGKDMTERRLRQERELELNLARSVQRDLFPSGAPALPGLDIAGLTLPAAEMCGDYFDYIPVGGARLALAIGDVSGHGLGPALVMAATRAYLRAYLRALPGVKDILDALNETLAADLEEGRFVTMLLAVLDACERRLTFANAGHTPGFVLDAEGRTRWALESSGTPLGLVPGQPVRTTDCALAPGDTVVLLTDGITECRAPDGRLLGADGALAIVRSRLGGSARETLDALVAGVRDFAAGEPQADDITAIVCRVEPDG